MDYDTEYSTKSASETQEIGERLAVALNRLKPEEGARLLCLHGELGSGKTTFAQGFARGLGISGRLLSPTFIIVRRYGRARSDSTFLYHIDLYRISDSRDVSELGLLEIFADQDAFVLIEWAERIADMLPEKRTELYFDVVNEGTRRIRIVKTTV